jgi:hypothetical protein
MFTYMNAVQVTRLMAETVVMFGCVSLHIHQPLPHRAKFCGNHAISCAYCAATTHAMHVLSHHLPTMELISRSSTCIICIDSIVYSRTLVLIAE